MFRATCTLVTRLMLLSFLAVIAGVAPALADTFYSCDLSGVTLSGGGSVTGDFTYDATTGIITSWNITANQGTSPVPGPANPFTYPAFPAATMLVDYSSPTLTQLSLYEPASGGAYPLYDLYLSFAGPASDLAAPGQLTLLLNNYSSYGVVASSTSYAYYNLTGGSLSLTDTVVPLPPSAFLLGSGLIALVWTRRKKRLG